MSEENEKCPHCGTDIDFCPHCKAIKPSDSKFCDDCFEMWKNEREAVQEMAKVHLDHIDEKYNYEGDYERYKRKIEERLNDNSN